MTIKKTDFFAPIVLEELLSWETFFESRKVIQIKAINAMKRINASHRDMISSNIIIASMTEAIIAIGMSLFTVVR